MIELLKTNKAGHSTKKVCAMIGDASLGGGVFCYQAKPHHTKTRINSNKMYLSHVHILF